MKNFIELGQLQRFAGGVKADIDSKYKNVDRKHDIFPKFHPNISSSFRVISFTCVTDRDHHNTLRSIFLKEGQKTHTHIFFVAFLVLVKTKT